MDDSPSRSVFRHPSAISQWFAGSFILALIVVATALPVLNREVWLFPGDAGDGSLILYLLEHSWNWVQSPWSVRLWDPQFYYPVQGTAAFSDLLVASGPIYWASRLLGLGIPASATIWFVGQLVCNGLAGTFMLRYGPGFSPLASTAGAALIVAANPIQNQFFHPQMIPTYWVLLSAGCLIRSVRISATLTTRQARFLLLMAAGFFSLQMYTSFYMAWFQLFVCGLAFVLALLIPTTRRQIITALRLWRRELALTVGVLLISLIPWLLHYLPASQISPPANAESIFGWIPRWFSWLYMGPLNRFYQWSLNWDQFGWLPPNEIHEHRIGFGLVTTVVVGAGLFIARERPWSQVVTLLCALIFTLVTIAPGGVGLWTHIFEYIPGASAVRTVTRIAIPLVILMAFAVAWLTERLVSSRQWALAVLIALLVGIEGSSEFPSFAPEPILMQAQSVASQLESQDGCSSFLYAPDKTDQRPAFMKQQTALWVGHISGIPTVNGYGHILPENWQFDHEVVDGNLSDSELQVRIDLWENEHPESSPICVIN